MDNAINAAFYNTLNNDLINIIISNSSNRELISKIKVRPVMLKRSRFYQISEYKGEKVYHSNYKEEELLALLPTWFEGLFRQVEITTKQGKVIILISKKGKATVNDKRKSVNYTERSDINEEELLSHNKRKNYILIEGEALPFLVDLGVMTREGLVIKAKMDKFRQINRFLEYIEDVLPYLDKDKELTILDFGCGKSYLTFTMYYYLTVVKEYQINIVGLDLKSDVIKHCNSLSKKYGYDKLLFMEGDIASYQGSSSVDMVVTLHACDTATDYALYKAVQWDAKVILSVPCCQHELNQQIDCEVLKPVLKYGIVRERMAALITDALRAELLEEAGYRVQLLEFIDMEHTPKNILIRAVKRKNAGHGLKSVSKERKACLEFLGVAPSLLRLLQEETIEEGK
ncbi:SAM-dependent methyltransferase [Lachnospiraceae bacterium MD1]|uniref:SAM-dependent methyltransferase n=1 Tax=Variimorphobacter saccharofermentans TaxID=2755051 RepID=A0A839K3R1_9FIRM|nr:SAM-dependent methyltransferase [Variimorphobacter saccharofermentans]MBB2184543.1 SAM-dependent methyltransferase [Variimorphobacter saccharofermentans]